MDFFSVHRSKIDVKQDVNGFMVRGFKQIFSMNFLQQLRLLASKNATYQIEKCSSLFSKNEVLVKLVRSSYSLLYGSFGQAIRCISILLQENIYEITSI